MNNRRYVVMSWRMRKLAIVCAWVTLVALACKGRGNRREEPSPEQGEKVASEEGKQKVVARVNGEDIFSSSFEAELAQQLLRHQGRSQEAPQALKQRLEETTLQRMVDDLLIAQKARELGIEVSTESIDAELGRQESRFRDAQAFREYLKQSGQSLETVTANIRRSLLRDAVVARLAGEASVPDNEVRRYFDDNAARFAQKARVKAARIVVRVPDGATVQEIAAKKRQAQSLWRKVKAPSADFSAIAREQSQGANAAAGGDLGWVTRDRVSPEVSKALFALKPAQVSRPIETKVGFEILKAYEVEPERAKSFEEVEESIRGSLLARQRDDKRRQVIESLRADAKVEQLVRF